MGYDLWQKLRRYLILWVVMALSVCVVCVLKNWDLIKLYFSNTFSAICSTVLTGVIIIGGIAMMLRR